MASLNSLFFCGRGPWSSVARHCRDSGHGSPFPGYAAGPGRIEPNIRSSHLREAHASISVTLIQKYSSLLRRRHSARHSTLGKTEATRLCHGQFNRPADQQLILHLFHPLPFAADRIPNGISKARNRRSGSYERTSDREMRVFNSGTWS